MKAWNGCPYRSRSTSPRKSTISWSRTQGEGQTATAEVEAARA